MKDKWHETKAHSELEFSQGVPQYIDSINYNIIFAWGAIVLFSNPWAISRIQFMILGIQLLKDLNKVQNFHFILICTISISNAGNQMVPLHASA